MADHVAQISAATWIGNDDRGHLGPGFWLPMVRRSSESQHVSLIPAAVMFLTVLSFNLLGDRVRELANNQIYP